jgi:hypothetical protein
MIETFFPDEKPTCPGCSSADLKHLNGEQLQCVRCGWRIVLDPDGSPRSMINLTAAGRTRRRSRPHNAPWRKSR